MGKTVSNKPEHNQADSKAMKFRIMTRRRVSRSPRCPQPSDIYPMKVNPFGMNESHIFNHLVAKQTDSFVSLFVFCKISWCSLLRYILEKTLLVWGNCADTTMDPGHFIGLYGPSLWYWEVELWNAIILINKWKL